MFSRVTACASAAVLLLAAAACTTGQSTSPARTVSSAPQTPAPSHVPQFSGDQLKSALLPGADFPPGYSVAPNSGWDTGKLGADTMKYSLGAMSCNSFFVNFNTPGFGEDAMVSYAVDNPAAPNPLTVPAFSEGIRQFSNATGARAYFWPLGNRRPVPDVHRRRPIRHFPGPHRILADTAS